MHKLCPSCRTPLGEVELIPSGKLIMACTSCNWEEGDEDPSLEALADFRRDFLRSLDADGLKFLTS